MQLAPVAGAPRAGRKAYACIAWACLAALSGRRWVRGTRADAPAGPPLSADQLRQALQQMAASRLDGLLGLARRQGAAVVGAARVAEAFAEDMGVVVVAHDAAERAVRQLQQAGHLVQAVPWLDQTALGGRVGAAPVAALGIRPGRQATQAAYWLRVWYEAQSQVGPWAQATSAQQTDDTPAADETSTGRRIEVAR